MYIIWRGEREREEFLCKLVLNKTESDSRVTYLRAKSLIPTMEHLFLLSVPLPGHR
jgi:hypothetical protein